jgi:hypothetical protein
MVAEVKELYHIITGVGAADPTAAFEHNCAGTSDVKQRLELGILSGNSSQNYVKLPSHLSSPPLLFYLSFPPEIEV